MKYHSSCVDACVIRLDAAGLMWTENKRLHAPDYEIMRFEYFESGQAHPYVGHYGVMLTKKKAEQLYH